MLSQPVWNSSGIARPCCVPEHPGVTIAVNFPGIGNGRLRREAVLPIVQLPDQVTIWEYPLPGKGKVL
jgi:hypothetical protein